MVKPHLDLLTPEPEEHMSPRAVGREDSGPVIRPQRATAKGDWGLPPVRGGRVCSLMRDGSSMLSGGSLKAEYVKREDVCISGGPTGGTPAEQPPNPTICQTVAQEQPFCTLGPGIRSELG